jgi:hypothetical protein
MKDHTRNTRTEEREPFVAAPETELEEPGYAATALQACQSSVDLVAINDRSYRKCAGEDAPGADGCSGRRTFDKTVSSKPLAFAADAAPMGIQWRFGTRVRVGTRIFGRMDQPFGSQGLSFLCDPYTTRFPQGRTVRHA